MGTTTCVCICVVFSKSWYERETAKGLVTSCVMCLTASQCILYLCSSGGLSCLLGLMYHPHVWGEQTLVTHQLWRRGLLEGRVAAGWIWLLFVFTTEKSVEVTFLLSLHPSHRPSVPHPYLSHQASQGGKPGNCDFTVLVAQRSIVRSFYYLFL